MTHDSAAAETSARRRSAGRAALRRLLCPRSALALAVGGLFLAAAPSATHAQQRQLPRAASDAQAPAADARTRPQRAAPRASREVINLYTDAANFQNAGAYPLAIEAWKKFLTAFPKDPLAAKARHYLGVCYLQLEEPNYEAAIESFRGALADPQLEVREDALINLAWCLFSTASTAQDEAVRERRLRESLKVLEEFLQRYPDGAYVDKAMFYAAEAEYQLGNVQKAAARYRVLVNDERFANSGVLPDALYALGVAYEELGQPKLAYEVYERFLKDHPEHRLAREIRLRTAEYLLSADRADEAVVILTKIAADRDTAMRDYVLYRLGYALAKADQFEKSAAAYELLSREYPDSSYATDAALAAGQALMRQNRLEEAKPYFERLLPGKDELAAQAAHWLAQIAILQGEPQGVIATVRDALGWAQAGPTRVDLQVDLADALSRTPEGAEEAASIYESVALEAADHPAAPRAAYNAAFAAMQAGRPEDALRWADLFAERHPDDPLAREVAFVRAESLLQSGKHGEAAAAFEQLAADHPDAAESASWRLRGATARFFAGDYDAAAPALQRIAQESSEPAARGEALFLLGASNFKHDKFAEAIEHFERSIAIEPAWPGVDEAYLILAEAYAKSGEPAKARDTLERLVEKFPESRFKTQAEFRLGQLSADAGDPRAAEAAYDAVLSAGDEPSLLEYARYGKAWAMIQLGEPAAAAKLLEPLAASAGDASLRHQALFALAASRRQAGDPARAAEALEALRRTATGEELLGKTLLELGKTYNELGRSEDSAAALADLADRFPDFPELDAALYETAWAFKRDGRDDLATETFQTLADRFPKSPYAAEAHYHIGQRDYDSRRYDAAVVAYTAAAAAEDDAVREKSLYKLGWAYYQQGQYAEAARFFGDLAREFPNGELAVDAAFMQGESALKQEEYKRAVAHYERAAELLAAAPAGSADPQVAELVYLHGAQAAREAKDDAATIGFTDAMEARLPQSQYLPLARFEKAFALQNLKRTDEALALFEQIADSQRNEIGARSRFMAGEILFAQRKFAQAVQAFQKVMYGYGATQAPADIRNWQARAAIEAGRCSDILIGELSGERRTRAIEVAKGFYKFVVENHPEHELAATAAGRLAELK